MLLQDLVLSPVGRRSHGHCVMEVTSVPVLRVEGGRYEEVELITDAEECYGWEERVNCSDILAAGEGIREDEGVAGIVITAVAMVFVFIAVVGAVMGMRGVKSGID